MTSTVLQSLVRELRQAAEARQFEALPDAELLERFRATGDPDAFEAIVRRHGASVLSACRSVLTSHADVEDAFQATFVVLLRSAPAIRKGQSLSGWLWGVAHRVALNALRAALRRQRAEQRQPAPTSAGPDPSWREACAVLHEELDGLPDEYRLPLLLCYLHGKTRDEAARQLGIREAVLHGRLERGRRRLRARLTRRGVTPSAGLLSWVVNSVPAGGPPETLVRLTLEAAAAGRVPVQIAALVHGATPSMTTGKITLLAALVLAAGLIAGIANAPISGSTAGPTPVAAQPTPEANPAEPAQEPQDKPLEMKGQVIDPEGKPVAGAKVVVVPFTGKENGFAPVEAPDLTGAEGRFRFQVPVAKVYHAKYEMPVPALVATAPGYFPAWEYGREGFADVTLRLARADARVTGRVVSLEGKPVPNATVRVTTVLAPTAATLDPWLAAVKARKKEGALALEQEFLPNEIRADVLPGVTLKAATDADGRFELAGYGQDRVLRAVIEGPTIVSREVRFVTRDVETVQMSTHGRENLPGATPYYGTRGTHAAAPTRPVAGVVRDQATRRPLAGVVIKSYTMAPHARIGEQFHAQATSDAEGRFTLLGMPKGEGNTVVAIPGEKEAYVPVHCGVPDPPGFGPVPIEIALVPGVWIEGTVKDKRTGKPVRMAEVQYHPDVFENRTVKSVPGLGDNYDSHHRYHVVATRADGKFRVLGLPGKGYVYARAHDRQYLAASDRSDEGGDTRDLMPTLPHSESARNWHAVYRVDVPEKPGPFTRDLVLDTGLHFTVSVVGPDGKPVRGAQSFGQDGHLSWYPESEPGRHAVESYNPRQPRPVLFRHVEKNLVGTLSVPADFAGDRQTVNLTPGVTVTGRVLDEDVQPRVGAEVTMSFQRTRGGTWAEYQESGEKYVTDAEGRYKVPGFIPGFRYGVSVGGVHWLSFTVEPGTTGTKDVGDIRLGPPE